VAVIAKPFGVARAEFGVPGAQLGSRPLCRKQFRRQARVDQQVPERLGDDDEPIGQRASRPAVGGDRPRGGGRSFVRSIDYWLWGLENGLTVDPLRCQRIASALAPIAEQCNLSHIRG
jgi:hypothetical protein